MFGGVSTIATTGKSKELEINGQIRDREVRLIGADGAQKGVVTIQAAMRAAEEAGLDLVKIAPQAKPPVCKLLDYGKYRFEQQKKEKEAKKNQKVVEVKETRLSLNIDTNWRTAPWARTCSSALPPPCPRRRWTNRRSWKGAPCPFC